MKKSALLLGGLFLISIALTSCKKDYTCECTVGGVTTKVTLPKTTKKKAQDACDVYKVAGVTCDLK
jgi:hypothetical protein